MASCGPRQLPSGSPEKCDLVFLPAPLGTKAVSSVERSGDGYLLRNDRWPGPRYVDGKIYLEVDMRPASACHAVHDSDS